jgi:hypothetical protein
MYSEFENRMAVEGQSYQEELYGTPDEEFFEDEYDDVVTYCDINKCSDCPRMGDDCDGEDRMAYYEREGDDIVYYYENDCEIYREPA